MSAPRARLLAWRMMEREDAFDAYDVVRATMLDIHSARVLLSRLRRDGHLDVVREAGPATTARYRLISVQVPRYVDATAEWQRQAWRTMRMMRAFTADEVLRAIPGPLTKGNLRRMIRDLLHFEWIQPLTSGRTGVRYVVSCESVLNPLEDSRVLAAAYARMGLTPRGEVRHG